MASRRSTNRFADTNTTDPNSVLSGIQQSIDPRFDKAFISRNLSPYRKYLPSTKPKYYQKIGDTRLRKIATKAVLGMEKIKPRKPAKPKAKPKRRRSAR